MRALIPSGFLRSAALVTVAGALAAGAAHAGGRAFGRPVVVVPSHSLQHRVPARVHPGSSIIRPAVPPVFFSPVVVLNPFVPGFVTFAPPVVVVTPVAVPIHAPHTVPFPAPVPVQPQVPVMAPSSPLFFAPPVRTVAPPMGGQVLIIQRTGH